jgi:hypothetical protein
VLLGEAVVVKLPERLQDLSRAMVLTGTVAGQTPEGLTRIRTQVGEVLLDLAAALSADKPVTLQITAGQPPGRAMVFANPPPAGQAASQAAGQAATAPPQPAGAPPAVLLTLPTAAPAMPAAAVPLLLPGSILPALVLAAAKPTTPPGPGAPPAARPAPATTAPTTPSPATPSAAVPTSAAPAAPAPATPPAGTPAATLAAAGPPSDAPVQLGGDAAHPGASPPLPSGAKPAAKPDPAATPKVAPLDTAPAEPKAVLQATPQAPPKAAPQTIPPAVPQTAPPATAQPVPRSAPQPAPQPTADAAPQSPPPAVPAKPAPMLVQGATVALKIVSVAQPGRTAPVPLEAPLTRPAPAESEGPLLHGTVAGATPQGQPILATRQGMLVLTTQGPLPPGTRVTVALTDPVRAQHAAAPHGVEAPADARDWPALRQVIAALAAADPELARTLTNTILPQPNKKLGAALTFLLSAMRNGDARGWLGEEAVGTLERNGRATLLKQLEEEMRAPPRPATDAAPAEWKPFAVPMLDGHALQAMQVQIRRVDGDEGGGAAGEREARGSRFLIDLDLSRFGPLQLDGLVRPQRFDLILRTHTPLPAELHAELTGVFADSLGAVGFTGTLSFQNGARNWVKLTRAGRAGLGVTA